MARGTQFQQLVAMLRAEIRRSTNVAVGVDDLPDLKQAINRQYAIQRERYAWPFLRYRFILPLKQGQQYYSMPSLLTTLASIPGIATPPPASAPPTTVAVTMSHRHVLKAAVMWSGVPMWVSRGIDFEDYAMFDYEQSGATSDPAVKWDVVAGSPSQTQFEIWPVPSSNAQFIRFLAGVETPALVNDTDQCWLDDMLVVMFAAADCLALDMSEPRVGLPPAAQLKLQQAEAYFASLTANETTGGETIAIGQGRPKKWIDTNALVRVRG